MPPLAAFETLAAALKFYVAHAAGFAALGKLAYDVLNRDFASALADLTVAGAAFGLNAPPAAAPAK